MAKLDIDGLHLRYGDTPVLQGIEMHLQEGEIACLLGRSGSGKTTLLRAIAGLEQPSAGRIGIAGTVMVDAERGVFVPPERRGLGLVFQSYALWPHRTVQDNVAYGLKLRGAPAAERERRVAEVLDGVGLGTLGARYPHQLSGGQQQRVALARALVYEPPVILMDEPLSNLDAKLREEARVWIRALIKRRGLTAVFVTHDQVEAMAIADRIVLLDGGRIVQDGTPEQLYQEPATLFASEFMGSNNTLPVTVQGRNGGAAAVSLDGHALQGALRGASVDATATAVIRVEDVQLTPVPGDNTLPAEHEMSVYLGGRYEHVFRVGTHAVRALGGPVQPGTHHLFLPPERLWVF